MKIIIRAPNWIGDAVMSIPAIANLSLNFPDSEIWIAATEWVKDLFTEFNFIHKTIALPNSIRTNNWKKSVSTIKKFQFDTGLLLTNSIASAFLFYKAGIPKRWGYKRDGRGFLLTRKVPFSLEGKKIHQVEYYLNLISGLGLEVKSKELYLPLNEKEVLKSKDLFHSQGIDFKKPIVMMNPGAFYGSAKQWPAIRFAQTASLFQKHSDADIVIIGSLKERPLAETIAEQMFKKPLIMTGKTTLQQLIALISTSTIFITNDSGPMHIASALKIPVVAIFGPTDYRITAPFHSLSSIIKRQIPCWPCLYRTCPFDHRCMISIPSEEVFEAGLKYLK